MAGGLLRLVGNGDEANTSNGLKLKAEIHDSDFYPVLAG